MALRVAGKQGHQVYAKMHVHVPSTGTLSFDLQVSSEADWDYATVYTGSQSPQFHDPRIPDKWVETFIHRLSGEHKSRFSVPVQGGEFVAIVYEKDWAEDVGEDTMYVSDMSFVTTDPALYGVGKATDTAEVQILNGDTVVATVISPYPATELTLAQLPQGAQTFIRLQKNIFSSGAMKVEQRTSPRATEFTSALGVQIGSGKAETVIDKNNRDPSLQ